MNNTRDKAKAYSSVKYGLAIADIILSLALFFIIQFSGLSLYAAQKASGVSANPYLALIMYMIFIGALLDIAGFPLDFLGSFKVEHAFGLSRQNFSSWFKDYIKKIIIGAFISSILILILYYLLAVSVFFWWLYAALIYFFFSVVLARVFPVIIIPLFYKLTEISEAPLKNNLIALAKKAGVKVVSVYNIALGEKTKKANAAICGLGATKRILLSDTLLEGYDEDEIEATLAHELAHSKYGHFWKLCIYNFIFTMLCFSIINAFLQRAVSAGYIKDISDISFFPSVAIIFIIYNILISPLFNFISRSYETEADAKAIELTGKPLAFSNLIKKLTLQNLSDPKPGLLIKLFFYDHPTAEERIISCGAVREKYN